MDAGFVSSQAGLLTFRRVVQSRVHLSSHQNQSSFVSPRNRRVNSVPSDVQPSSVGINKRSTVTAQASSENTDDDGDDDDDDDPLENTYHESWDIYSKPGNLCVVCLGKGYNKCLYCNGTGYVRVGPEEERDTVPCPQCNGTGKEMCMRCEGTGIRPNFRYVLNETGDGVIKVRNPTNEEINNLPPYYESEDYQIELRRAKEAEEKYEAEQREKQKEQDQDSATEESEQQSPAPTS